MSVAELRSTRATVRSGYLDPTAPAAVEIEPGDTVRYLDTWTHWGNEAVYGMSFADREPLRHRYPKGPYSMVGPVEIAGAAPGDVVECAVLDLRTIDWGWNSFPHGVGALPDDFAEPYVHYFRFDDARTGTDYTHGVRLPLRPMIGVLGVEPGGDEVSAITAGPWGGNLVLPELGVGASVFLPVRRPRARVWLGDIHARQAEGVVDQTGIETAAERIDIRYALHRRVPLDAPLVETATHWVRFGFADNLDDALVACLRGTIAWLAAVTDLSPSEAYALCSMAVDFRVTQYANQTASAYSATPPKTVHAMIPKDVFDSRASAAVGAWLRGGS
ncbi:amidase [Leifsonia sp. LS1]|uniref:acetamidase/formamidase family protein n=1 Tax=Leifsonia sp. LS1 TaxID=2828483 RepID=UPI001CFEAA52|nr:acetamidase/formamidase family protein [Leifsonia sp. LS1]GIT79424.1 amidase [Leifsonia sp. LS1]